MTRTAFVIGATSMLGKQLIMALKGSGIEVISCGRGVGNDVQYDLLETELPGLPVGMKADVIYHCAAAFAGDSLDGCIENEKVNAISAYIVAELAWHLGASQVVYAGSIFSVAPEGLGSYGASKLRGEDILEWALAKKAIAFASLRLPQLFDEVGECCRHQPWLGRIVAYAYAGKVLRMPGGNALRNFLHVRDAAVLMIAAYEHRVGGRTSVAHPESIGIEDIARLAYRTFGNGGSYVIAAEKQPFRDLHVPDSSESFRRLEYWPKISMQDGMLLIRDKGRPEQFGPMDVE